MGRARTPAVETPVAPCRSAPVLPGHRLELSAGASAVASPTTPGSTPGSLPSGTGLTRSWRTTETSRLFRPDTRKVFKNHIPRQLLNLCGNGSHLYPSNKHYNIQNAVVSNFRFANILLPNL